jgi:hypothetical protein
MSHSPVLLHLLVGSLAFAIICAALVLLAPAKVKVAGS